MVIILGRTMNKLPIEFSDDAALISYLSSKSIVESDKIISLIRRYGIVDTINPVKKLICSSLDSNWKHQYSTEISYDIVYDNYMTGKRFNRLLFSELDEFERLFTSQLMNVYLSNHASVDSIINYDTKGRIRKEATIEFLDSFINSVKQLSDDNVNSNQVFSFFYNSINAEKSSLGRKINLFKILNDEYKISIISQVNEFGNFNLSTDINIINRTIELNALNKLRNAVCHNNSIQYNCYETQLEEIFKRILNDVANANSYSNLQRKIKKSITNLKYENSLTAIGIRVLNRSKLVHLEGLLQLKEIYRQTNYLYEKSIYQEFKIGDTEEETIANIRSKIKSKRPFYSKKFDIS